MRINHLIAAVSSAGLFVLASNVMALEVQFTAPSRDRVWEGVALPKGDHGALPPQGATTCPADIVNAGVPLVDGDQWSGDTTNSGDDFVAGCGANNTGDGHTNGHGPGGSDQGPHGRDEIFEFSVSVPGVWGFDTCTVPACWDTSLEIREETGGGCPGDFVSCDGDGCFACYYESLVTGFLIPASTYYLIVDGWNEYAYGSFTVTASLLVPGCTSDAECDDGDFCTGAETCITATGQCVDGDRPCDTFEGYTADCDAVNEVCVKRDPSVIWAAGTVDSGYFWPNFNTCPDVAAWQLDDVQASHHTSGVLDFYTTPITARSTPTGASPVGTVFLVNQALFTTADGCNPDSIIAGSECTAAATVDPGGAPPHPLPCSGQMPDLPNNSGNFNKCEIDFFIAQRTSENGAGFGIAGSLPEIGGPGAADDFGITVFWQEDCPPTGAYGAGTFGDDVNTPSDFEGAIVCGKPAGSCCHPDGSCSQTSEEDCDGSFGATGTVNGTDGGCGGDPDGDGVDNRCGDNCEDDANPGQEDCDGDGEGDACEADACDQDDDGDGVCNCVDNCPDNANADQADCDGDGNGDECDICPCADPDDADGDGVCDDIDICFPGDDNVDTDGDGVPDDCDECPGKDDGAAGALGDDDGDGVLNCNDQCNGVDDAVFAPECSGKIPAVSEWGIVILALLLLAGGKVYFGRRETLA